MARKLKYPYLVGVHLDIEMVDGLKRVADERKGVYSQIARQLLHEQLKIIDPLYNK